MISPLCRIWPGLMLTFLLRKGKKTLCGIKLEARDRVGADCQSITALTQTDRCNMTHIHIHYD